MADDTNTQEQQETTETSRTSWGLIIIFIAIGLLAGGMLTHMIFTVPAKKQAIADIHLVDSTARAHITALESGLASAKDDLSSCENSQSILASNYGALQEEADTLREKTAVLDSTLKARDTQLAQALASPKKGKKSSATATEPAATGTAANTLPAGITGKSKPR